MFYVLVHNINRLLIKLYSLDYPPTNNCNIIIEGNYFDASTAFTVFDFDISNGCKFVLFNSNIFSNSMFNNQITFGTNTIKNVQAIKNRVLSGINGNGYEVNAYGYLEVTDTALRYKDSSNIKFVQSGIYQPSTNKPALTFPGMMMFDTTLNKPIWKTNSGWVDSQGNIV